MSRVIITLRTKTGETFVAKSSHEVGPGEDPVQEVTIHLARCKKMGYLRLGKTEDWAGEVIVDTDNIAFVTVSEAL